MDLSVVLCTWNNSRRLRVTLEALSRCAVPATLAWELILVNNNCTDDTDLVVAEFSGALPLVQVREPRQGLSAARNRGVAASAGGLTIFTDDDVIPARGWLAAYWHAYRSRGGGHFFGGPVESAFEAGAPEPELMRVAPYSVKGLDWGPVPRPLRRNEAFIGANWACPAEAIAAVGGFDESTGLNAARKIRTADETDLMRRLKRAGLTAYYVPDARITHWVTADKCSLGHIAARMEATKHYWATVRARDARELGPGWRYRRAAELTALELWLKWVWVRARMQRGSRQYVEWRGAVGTMMALREAMRSARTEPSR
jgi:glycosyltransferase involved in cell wall biosynthesis